MRIAMHCGQDSDCNTSSVGGILGNWLGLSKIPEDFKSNLSDYQLFSYTDYRLWRCDRAERAARPADRADAGRQIEGTGESEVWYIPTASQIEPPILEQWPAAQDEPPELAISFQQHAGRKMTLTAEASDPDGILEVNGISATYLMQQGRKSATPILPMARTRSLDTQPTRTGILPGRA